MRAKARIWFYCPTSGSLSVFDYFFVQPKAEDFNFGMWPNVRKKVNEYQVVLIIVNFIVMNSHKHKLFNWVKILHFWLNTETGSVECALQIMYV